MNYINNMKKNEINLSKHACKDESAVRLKEEKPDFRTEFFRDIDKIIHSLSYTRYIDKTQVFTNIDNDNVSKRIIHVQLVSKIARTIGRALNLNEDLIEAASLGHDLGHTPFGHVGESILNEISLNNNEGYFYHNVQSVRNLMTVENNGVGKNITLQVLDAILCHNGEVVEGKYYPIEKNKEQFLKEYKACYENPEIVKSLKPMTLEGCVVRISDVISYIGRDIDDAISLGILKNSDIPSEIANVLGRSNSEIINTIVLDIIKNSQNKNYIKMSEEVFKALNKLKDFNYEKIYNKSNTLEQISNYKKMLTTLFDIYLTQINKKEKTAEIYTVFLNNMTKEYLESTTNERIVLDYISGMTDDFVFRQYKKYTKVNTKIYKK